MFNLPSFNPILLTLFVLYFPQPLNLLATNVLANNNFNLFNNRFFSTTRRIYNQTFLLLFWLFNWFLALFPPFPPVFWIICAVCRPPILEGSYEEARLLRVLGIVYTWYSSPFVYTQSLCICVKYIIPTGTVVLSIRLPPQEHINKTVNSDYWTVVLNRELQIIVKILLFDELKGCFVLFRIILT